MVHCTWQKLQVADMTWGCASRVILFTQIKCHATLDLLRTIGTNAPSIDIIKSFRNPIA